MTRQRLLLFALLTLTFVGVALIAFRQIWTDATTRFRTGLPVPRSILPDELLSPLEIIPKGPPRAPDIRPTDPLLSGNASSSLTVIVFGDFQCDYCRDQAQALEDALRLIDRRADIRIVWRDLPLVNQHPRAMAAATVARCASQQGKFKAMHDALFFRATALNDTEFLNFARQQDLNQDAFLVCLRDPAIAFQLNRDIEAARKLAITSVPMIFVNGQAISGYVDTETLTAIFRQQLAQKGPNL